MIEFKRLKECDVKGKKVLLRADLNVPTNGAQVTDTTRIDLLKKTIAYLKENGARTIIMAHFGRPKGKVNPEYSLEFITSALEKSWDTDVKFVNDCIGNDVKSAVDALQDSEILLLENVRFHEGEEKNDPTFSKQLASLGDLYVNDAFSAAHRAHASTEGVSAYLPVAAGFLMEAELDALNKALENPEKPIIAIVGGAKVSTKLGVLKHLSKKVDHMILGGAMATTFLYAKGAKVGTSLYEKDMANEARAILAAAKANGCTIHLPVDVTAAKVIEPHTATQTVDPNAIPDDLMSLDAGPETREIYADVIKGCKTVLWNGPIGVFEVPPFDEGTNALAHTIADLTKQGKLISVAGGGDTMSALANAEVENDFTYISSAGGAFLEWMEGKVLPGVAALSQTKKAA